MNILLLKYNNYFNRIIKKSETVSEYQEAASAFSLYTNINFNPADGVDTELIVGGPTQKDHSNKPLRWDTNGSPDYMLVLDGNTIISRWYVIECDRTRLGQYKVALRRDVIVDNINTVLDATAYIEKGIVDANNVLVYNKESIEFNKIKKSETLLKDGSGCPWLVAYIAKNAEEAEIEVAYDPSASDYIALDSNTISQWDYYTYTNNVFYTNPTEINYCYFYRNGIDIYNANYKAIVNQNAGTSYLQPSIGEPQAYASLRTSLWTTVNDVVNGIKSVMLRKGMASFNSRLLPIVSAHTDTETNKFFSFNNKVLKTGDGKYYRVAITAADSEARTLDVINSSPTSEMFSLMRSVVRECGEFADGYNDPNNDNLKVDYKLQGYKLTLTEISSVSATLAIPATRAKTVDSQYDIIALPYGDIEVGYGRDTAFLSYGHTSKELSMAAMTAIAQKLASACYDVQLLPYCPIPSCIDINNRLVVNAADIGITHEPIEGENLEFYGMVFFVPKSSFTVDIPVSIPIERARTVSGFEYLTIDQCYPVLKYTDIVIPEIIASTTANTSYTAYTGDGSSRITNHLHVKKVSKETLEVISDYYAAKMDLYLDNDSDNNYIKFSTYSSVSTTYTEIETITYNGLQAANYYLVINFESHFASTASPGTIWTEIFAFFKYDYLNSEVEDVKIDNQCNMYRIVSPNYQGEFEFSVVKNNGVDYFNVDCTYKPYNPYIHVSPNFKNLYGQDFDDARGLVCNGDFTFGMIGDAFAQYEMQNKNYREIFDRQITNLDVNNAINKQEAIAQAITGTISGAATGAATGALTGGGVGAAAIGGVAGALLSGAGGVADLINLQKRQQEQKSFTTDMFNLNLETIQARPYSLSKCSALTYNNKLFPFIEKYSCTDTEKEIFKNKLKYDGMTVMAIGKISDYNNQEGTLVRGDIIRINLEDETHMANAIHQEILKGVYL